MATKFYEPEILKRVQQTELEILKDFMAVCDEAGLRYFGIAGTGIGAVRHGGFIPWDDDIDLAMPRADFDRAMKLVEEKLSDRYYILNCETDPNYPLMTTRLCKKGTRFQEEAMQGVKAKLGIFLDLYPYDNLADGKAAYFFQVWTAWFYSKLLILRSVSHPYMSFGGWKRKLAQGICCLASGAMRLFRISPRWIYRRCDRICRKYNGRKTRRMGFPGDTSPHWNTLEKSKVYPLKKYPFEDILLNFPKDTDRMLKNFFGDYMQLPPVEKRKTHYPHVLDFGDGVNVVK